MLAAWVVVAIIVHMLVVCVAIGELVREFKRFNDREEAKGSVKVFNVSNPGPGNGPPYVKATL